MLDAAFKAIEQMRAPRFRTVFWKSLGITIIMLIGAWCALTRLLAYFVELPYYWADSALSLVAAIGILVALAFLIGPVTSLVAGLYLDDIAEAVERDYYPGDPPGEALPLADSLFLAAKFTLLVIAVNILALLLLLVPGVNLIAFFGANGYLLGREYFEMAGLRHMDLEDVRELRRANSLRVFLAGMVIAGVMAIPLVNLLTPLFATAFMVHIFKTAAHRALA